MSVDELAVAELLRAIPGPLYVLDEHFRIAFVNEQTAAMIGASPGELVGHLVWDHFPGERPNKMQEQLRRAMRERSAISFTTYSKSYDRWFSVRIQPYRDGLAVFFHDVTDVKRAEEHWARVAEIRTALHRIAAHVAADAPPEETYELVCAECARLVGATGSWMLCLDGDEYKVLARFASDDVVRADARGVKYPVPVGGQLEQMRDSGRSVVAPEIVSGPLVRDHLRAAIFVPIRLHGTVWGALVVGWRTPRPDARDSLPWLEELTQLLSVGISSAEARAELAWRATTDALTGLANRRALDEQLEHSIARARRHGQRFTFAVFDVDEFKQINDGHGHETGDEVLRAVGDQLAAVIRGEDVAARMGGDEFALVLEGSDADASLAVVGRLRGVVEAELRARRLPVSTLSAGLCTWRPGVTPGELQRYADAALYRAKRLGRDRVCVAEVPITARARPGLIDPLPWRGKSGDRDG